MRQRGAAGLLIIGPGQLDGPDALYGGSLPVFSSVETNASGFVNSLQIRDVSLNAGQMAALGGPSPTGIPSTHPPGQTFVQYKDPGLNDVNDPSRQQL